MCPKASQHSVHILVEHKLEYTCYIRVRRGKTCKKIQICRKNGKMCAAIGDEV